jgi:hypothetical protein
MATGGSLKLDGTSPSAKRLASAPPTVTVVSILAKVRKKERMQEREG